MSLYSKRTGPANNKQNKFDFVYLRYALRRLKRFGASVKHLYAMKDFVRATGMNKRPRNENWYNKAPYSSWECFK